MQKKIYAALALFVVLLAILHSCKPFYFRSTYNNANTLLHSSDTPTTETPYLKAHLHNGDVCVLTNTWEIDTVKNILSGSGMRYNFNRELTHRGIIEIGLESIAIYETNKKITDAEAGRWTALGILTGLDATLGIVCLTNPKACFGSCPTFYVSPNDNFHYSDAEGFSNAILPSLEYADVDAIDQQTSEADSTFSLYMKNEALETHVIRSAELLYFPIETDERVYHSKDNSFYRCKNTYPLAKATLEKEEITPLLLAADRKEWFSYADATHLATKETLELVFPANQADAKLGLLLHFRQTLMTTYFIYNGISYMGNEVSDIFAKMETQGHTASQLEKGIFNELGKIDIELWDAPTQKWVQQNGLYETGPIAINKQIVPLTKTTDTNKEIKVRITLNKGLWRLDYAALTEIVDLVTPHPISPCRVIKNDKENYLSKRQLTDTAQQLVSMPGDAFELVYQLPEANKTYEVFVQS